MYGFSFALRRQKEGKKRLSVVSNSVNCELFLFFLRLECHLIIVVAFLITTLKYNSRLWGDVEEVRCFFCFFFLLVSRVSKAGISKLRRLANFVRNCLAKSTKKPLWKRSQSLKNLNVISIFFYIGLSRIFRVQICQENLSSWSPWSNFQSNETSSSNLSPKFGYI